MRAIYKNNYKRAKIGETTEIEGKILRDKGAKEEFWEKENISKPSWAKLAFSKDRKSENLILKDNNASSTNITTDIIAQDVESIDRMELNSNRHSKRSGPLSPIDSINLCKPSNNTQLWDKKLQIKI